MILHIQNTFTREKSKRVPPYAFSSRIRLLHFLLKFVSFNFLFILFPSTLNAYSSPSWRHFRFHDDKILLLMFNFNSSTTIRARQVVVMLKSPLIVRKFSMNSLRMKEGSHNVQHVPICIISRFSFYIHSGILDTVIIYFHWGVFDYFEHKFLLSIVLIFSLCKTL